MRRALACIGIFVGLLASSRTVATGIDHELIVLFDPRSNLQSALELSDSIRSNRIGGVAAELLSPVGARPLLRLPTTSLYRKPAAADINDPNALLPQYVILTYGEEVDLDAVMTALSRNPRILSIERNSRGSFDVVPSDTYFSANPPTEPTKFYQYGMQMLNFVSAWDITKGNAYVGLIDNGIRVGHADLLNLRTQFSRNLFSGQFDQNVDEAHSNVLQSPGHGTHVAGIIAATSNNAVGVAGGCWSCSLIVSTTNTSKEDLINNLAHIRAVGAQVANASFSQHADTNTCSISGFQAACQALDTAKAADLTIVASSGNDRNVYGGIGFPANSPSVIAVGGVTAAGVLWDEGTVGGFPFGVGVAPLSRTGCRLDFKRVRGLG